MSYLYNLFTHNVPIWHLPVALVLVHLVLYAYLTIFRGSFLAMLSLLILLVIGFRLVFPAKKGDA